MRFAAIILLISHALSVYAVQGTLGVATQVTANTATTINFGFLGLTGPSLVITTDADAAVTLDVVSSASVMMLPSGYQTLGSNSSATLGVGFSLTVSPAAAHVVSAQLTSGTLTSAAIAILASANIKAGCLQYDANAMSYNQVAFETPALGQALTVNLPDVGTYVFVGYTINSPIPTFYQYAQQLKANVASTLVYTQNGVRNFALNVTTSVDNSVKVAYNTTTTYAAAAGYIALNAFFQIDTGVQSTVQANLMYYYNATAVAAAGIAEDTLQFAYWTGTQWKFEGGASVNAQAGVVSQGSSHFSQWGVYGQTASSDASQVAALSLGLVAAVALAF